MQVDYLIVGQGICGTMLSWFLQQEGKRFIVLDEARNNSSSKVAAGIINPVTGRRYAYTWMIDEVMPFAVKTYETIGDELGMTLINKKGIIDFFPSVQMREAFVDRVTENDTYLHAFPDQNHYNRYFNYDFGCGEISPAYIANLPQLLWPWRQRLEAANALKSERFEAAALEAVPDGVKYKGIMADKIIFCDGVASMENTWFSLLPFAPNKGEVLIIECMGLPKEHIYKKGIMLAPLAEPGVFWVGSSYQWEFENDAPTEQFQKQVSGVLHSWLKVPFRILDHKSAVRPATIERRPFVGTHPQMPSVAILNGMGTKGTSLAPFFAHQLVQHLVHNMPIASEADVRRFSRILTKTHPT